MAASRLNYLVLVLIKPSFAISFKLAIRLNRDPEKIAKLRIRHIKALDIRLN